MNQSVGRIIRVASVAALTLFGASAVFSGGAASTHCHEVDGAFTTCGDSSAEWSDVTPDSFLNGLSFVYADEDNTNLPVDQRRLHLMYDYPGRTCSGPTDSLLCGIVEFDVGENGKIDHYKVVIGPNAACAVAGFDVFVNGIKLPEHLEEGIFAKAGCGPSLKVPGTNHQIYELSVPLVTVYQPDDPRFWSSGFPAPPPPPPNPDSDGDGVLNVDDNCPTVANPDQADSDNNGVGDACQAKDTDTDGIGDDVDNCPTIANPDQADLDGDGIGDACDPVDDRTDFDGDGIFDDGNDQIDNCPFVSNPGQEDANGDGNGDACDPCPSVGEDGTNTDPDGDGIPTIGNDVCTGGATVVCDDNCPSVSNGDQKDSDGDGLGDACDPCNDLTHPDGCVDANGDPTGDRDNDGFLDDQDNCPTVKNPGQEDADGDGLGDACDPCPLDFSNTCKLPLACQQCPSAADGTVLTDADGDGVADGVDNCPSVANSDQTDTDLDGYGDACDSCNDLTHPDGCVDVNGNPTGDRDNDGFIDEEDNCPGVANADQLDTDGDGFGNACDPCPADDTNTCTLPFDCRTCGVPDTDGDGVTDDIDNCVTVPNSDQADTDNDGIGDVCDSCPNDVLDLCTAPDQPPVDSDGDGVLNSDDNCPAVANADQADEDGDGLGDACDPCLGDPDQFCSCPAPTLHSRSLHLASSSGNPPTIQGHGSTLTAGSSGLTTSAPHGLCGDPNVCLADINSAKKARAKAKAKGVIKSAVSKRYAALIKCVKKGTARADCDLRKADKVGPLNASCRAVINCEVDSSLSLMFGTHSHPGVPPPGVPLTDVCAKSIGTNGSAFIQKQLALHFKGGTKEAAKIAASLAKTQKAIAKKCTATIPGAPNANLGTDCKTDQTVACLVNFLPRFLPIP